MFPTFWKDGILHDTTHFIYSSPTTFIVIRHFSRTFCTNSLWKNDWIVYTYKHCQLDCLHHKINSSTCWLCVIYVVLSQTKLIIRSHKEMFYTSKLVWKITGHSRLLFLQYYYPFYGFQYILKRKMTFKSITYDLEKEKIWHY